LSPAQIASDTLRLAYYANYYASVYPSGCVRVGMVSAKTAH